MLISPEYQELNTQLHDSRADYGTSGHLYAQRVGTLAAMFSQKLHRAPTILDYGAGKCTLAASLPQFVVKSYDPCLSHLSERPEPADLVICTDVMEHVEEEHVAGVLADISSLALVGAFFQISTIPAVKELADGRNAHITLKPWHEWLGLMRQNMDMELETYERLAASSGEQTGLIATLSKRGDPQ